MTLSHEPVMKPEEYPYPDEATVIEAMRQEDAKRQEDKVSDAPSAFMSPLQRTMSVAPTPMAAPTLLNEFATRPANQNEALRALFGKLRHTPAVLPGLRRTDYDGLAYEAGGTALVPDGLAYEAGGTALVPEADYDGPETYGGPNYPMPTSETDERDREPTSREELRDQKRD
jgi:hypothetical protein